MKAPSTAFPEQELEAQAKNSGRSRRAERFYPAAPLAWADLGLSSALLEQLILKMLYFRGELMGSEIARSMGLKFSFIEKMLDAFKMKQLTEVKSSLGYGPVSSVVALTDQGRRVARDYLETNQYVGQAPVPVSQYLTAVQTQTMPANWLSAERLAKAYSHLVVTKEVLDQIGPAVNAGRSLLIYGQPGNGKTQLAESLAKIQTTDIYVPYALEHQGNIIQLFDPLYHETAPAEEDQKGELDGRWARCRRPFIATGGELSLSMLDLSFNPVSKVYDAPFQLKANNGIYLIDDFGRQKASPVEILNRWIIPMERRVDYLSFANGGKMTVPFETFLIFSTNLTPSKLGDEAFQRRIQYKMLLRSPAIEEFRAIFLEYCASKSLAADHIMVDSFVTRLYQPTGKRFRRCHPRDLVSQAIDYIAFKRLPYELTDDLLDRVFQSCFVSETDLSDA